MQDHQLESAHLLAFQVNLKRAIEESKYIHHWGDGNFGYIIQEFFNTIKNYGYIEEIEQPKQVRKKIPASIKKQVMERDEYRCISCGTHIDLCIDHIHPFIAGGGNNVENLQTMCRVCNSKKGART